MSKIVVTLRGLSASDRKKITKYVVSKVNKSQKDLVEKAKKK